MGTVKEWSQWAPIASGLIMTTGEFRRRVVGGTEQRGTESRPDHEGHAHNEFCSERTFFGRVKKGDESKRGNRKVFWCVYMGCTNLPIADCSFEVCIELYLIMYSSYNTSDY